MKSHSPIQAPSGGKTCKYCNKVHYDDKAACPEYAMKNMTPIKTLEEAKKDFQEKFIGKGFVPTAEEVWSFLESTLSSLTEQMIPEEMDEYFSKDEQEYGYNDAEVDGFNKAVREMQAKRKELLEK